MADALERLARVSPAPPAWDAADAFVWHREQHLVPVTAVAALPLNILKGVDNARDTLLENTRRFAASYSANNALLWGARGMGKSALVKAVHHEINRQAAKHLALVEIHREDIETLPDLMSMVRATPRRVLIFCDDLSFDAGDASYKSLKAALEGGLEGRPTNALFYATSNRRHLMPRDMADNERSCAINPAEAVEEKVSLSDRFGLWLGFHACDQATYLVIVETYVAHFRLGVPRGTWGPEALAWAQERGARSGRVAWQFIQDLAGRLGKQI
jgi:hypothetical protein